MPFPDPETGLIYQPENENSISFTSEFIVYNPRLKYSMNFPEINFCGESEDILLIVGSFPAVSTIKKGSLKKGTTLKKKKKIMTNVILGGGVRTSKCHIFTSCV